MLWPELPAVTPALLKALTPTERIVLRVASALLPPDARAALEMTRSTFNSHMAAIRTKSHRLRMGLPVE